MKKQLLHLFIVFACQNLFSQNAYYDALFLNTITEKGLQQVLDAEKSGNLHLSSQEIEQLNNTQFFLKDPFDVNNNIKTEFSIEPVKSAINKYNILLKSEYGTGSYNAFGAGAASIALGIIGSAITGDFSLDAEGQTKILDGLTKYYAEEFRKAQLLTYMQTFESTIGEIGELRILFPKTYEKLKNADPSKFPELGDEYKEIFSKDLKALIENLIAHVENHKSADAIESKMKILTYANNNTIKKKPFYGSLKLAADIGSKLINNYHPVDLFYYLDANYYDKSYLSGPTSLDKELGIIIHGVNLFQKNLRDTTLSKTAQFSNVWLSHEKFNKIDTSTEWGLFAGLMYHQDKDYFKKLFFTPTKSRLDDSQILKIKERYLSILSALNQIQEFRKAISEDNLNENYIEYMNIVTNVLKEANFEKDDISKFFKISNYSLEVYDNARSKDYSNSIYYVTLILNEFLSSNSSYLETLQNIDKYGTFMTDVINSKDSDETKEVIRKHVAPPASFILKREFQNTFSITGQPGYFVSVESLNDDDNLGFVSGITLPIGFEYTFKLKNGQDNSDSFGIFAQAIDLGAILNFRVGDATSTLPDTVEFSQIFSPGGSLTYGFKNSPLTIGLGYQYTPELRKLTLENGNEISPNGHRIFLRLAWDIPLVNIWRSKKK